MRLSKIKLAGFKSFVDSTTIKFPSNLMGIVGPNGCGKSNVIDAVRWVLGGRVETPSGQADEFVGAGETPRGGSVRHGLRGPNQPEISHLE